MSKYLDDSLVQAVRSDPLPDNPPLQQYGGQIPTRHMIKFFNVWHRVYVMLYGNSGSAYVKSLGEDLFLSSETEYRFQK